MTARAAIEDMLRDCGCQDWEVAADRVMDMLDAARLAENKACEEVATRVAAPEADCVHTGRRFAAAAARRIRRHIIARRAAQGAEQ